MAADAGTNVGIAGGNRPGRVRRVWMAVREAAKERTALLAAAAVSVVVSLVTLLETYDGFLKEALGTSQAWFLVGINGVLTIILVVTFNAVVKPKRTVVYATVVALSFQALIATDLEVQPLAGSSEVGATSKVGTLYDPIEEWLASGIEDPVEEAKRAEIDRLRRYYTRPADLAKLRERLDDVLATESSMDADDRGDVMKEADGVIAKQSVPATTRVRDIALMIYESSGRDVVQDAAAR